jgi:N-methylhydantoinase A
VGEIAKITGQDGAEAAAAAIAIMTGNIARAIKLISLDRGHDPRRFPLIAFGGAGPMQAADVADDLEIDRIIVPPTPGVLCAMGLLYAPTRADFARTHLFEFGAGGDEPLRATFEELVRRAETWASSVDAGSADQTMTWSADMSFLGQDHYLTIALPERAISEEALQHLAMRFRDEYRRQYGSIPPSARERIVTARVSIQSSTTPLHEWLAPSPPSRPMRPIGLRDAYFPKERRFMQTPRFRREDLGPGSAVTGPAIVEQFDCTTILPPGWRLRVDELRNLILTRAGE